MRYRDTWRQVATAGLPPCRSVGPRSWSAAPPDNSSAPGRPRTDDRAQPQALPGRRRAMSSALVIASMTAVLKSLLDNRLIEHGVAATVGDVSVTALPPDRI